MARSYYRVRLGEGASYAEQCFEQGFIGVHWGFTEDLSDQFSEDYRDFNARFRPVYLGRHPDKSVVAAGLACGMLWTFGRAMKVGDIVLSPGSDGRFAIGEITSEYFLGDANILPQRRRVTWNTNRFARAELSDELKRSTNGPGTIVVIDNYADEIETLLGNNVPPAIVATRENIEDPSAFALEKHLEDFLVSNWSRTELGGKYEIFTDGDVVIGQQYPSDTGPIDILAISKDRKELLVVELKRGRASDVVVGQIQRYMGYVAGELATSEQKVRGVIIALDSDIRLSRALSVAPNIDFYRYEISFKLIAG